MIRNTWTSLCLFFLLSFQLQAQDANEAVQYIQFFNAEFAQMQHLQIEYSALLVHRREEIAARKRIEIIRLVEAAQQKFENVDKHPNDKSLKESAVNTINMLHKTVTQNYDEVIREQVGCVQCFEAVLAEFEMSEKDSKEISKAMEKMQKQIKKFAADHDIELVAGENEYDNVIDKINRLNGYTQQLDLVILEINYADAALIKAFNDNDIKEAKAQHKKLGKAISQAKVRFKKTKAIPEDKASYQQVERVIKFYEEANKDLYPDMLSAFDKSGKIKNEKVNDYNKAINKLAQGGPVYVAKYYEAKDALMKRNIPQPQVPQLKRT